MIAVRLIMCSIVRRCADASFADNKCRSIKTLAKVVVILEIMTIFAPADPMGEA